MPKQKSDEYYIRKAFFLSVRAKDPRPNPYVGAVIVKNNKIIASGFHQKAGTPHAEVIALDKAAKYARGATLYVTLEPCCHFGRTPPCVDKIINSGVKEVVVGMRDPNPLNKGRGIKLLRKAGIKVRVSILGQEAQKVNAVFIKYISRKLPYVCVKAGQSLDGKIATRNFSSRWITSSASRQFAHKLRGRFDAIMVGVNTLMADNPKLSGASKNIKVIVDTRLRTPLNSRVFGDGEIIIVTARKLTDNKAQSLIKKGARIITAGKRGGRVNLPQALRKLAELEISKILVEGGGELIGSLFDEKLVDEVKFFIAPKIIGGCGAVSSVAGKGVTDISKAVKLRDVKIRRIGEDFLVEGSVIY